MRDKKCPLVEFLFIADVLGEDADISPGWYSPNVRNHLPSCLMVFVTLLYTTSSVPVGDRLVIPARFRIFPNYDL